MEESRERICNLAIALCTAQEEAEKRTVPADNGLGSPGGPGYRQKAAEWNRELIAAVRAWKDQNNIQ